MPVTNTFARPVQRPVPVNDNSTTYPDKWAFRVAIGASVLVTVAFVYATVQDHTYYGLTYSANQALFMGFLWFMSCLMAAVYIYGAAHATTKLLDRWYQRNDGSDKIAWVLTWVLFGFSLLASISQGNPAPLLFKILLFPVAFWLTAWTPYGVAHLGTCMARRLRS